MNEIVAATKKIEVFALESAHLEVKVEATFDECMRQLEMLYAGERSIQWWIGDLVNYIDAKWPERYEQALEVAPYTLDTLQTYAYVCRQFPKEHRNVNVPFSIYQVAAGLTTLEERKSMVEMASREALSVRKVRAAVSVQRSARQQESREADTAPQKSSSSPLYVTNPPWEQMAAIGQVGVVVKIRDTIYLHDRVENMLYKITVLSDLRAPGRSASRHAPESDQEEE